MSNLYLVVLLIVCLGFTENSQARPLVIGRVTSDPRQTYTQLKPIVDYVASKLSDRGINEGSVLMAKNHEEMFRYLREGRVDWVQKGVFEALMYMREGGAEIALRSWRQGVPNYYSVIFVRRDSVLQKWIKWDHVFLAYANISDFNHLNRALDYHDIVKILLLL